MRHLRLTTALLAMTAIAVACSSAGNGSNGEASQAASSQGAGASQPAASTGGGGGGGGGGANGSITYEITGEFEASGELPFLAGGLSQWVESAGGWVANFSDPSGNGEKLILLNTQAGEGTPGQIFVYGDGKVLLTAASGETGLGCTFNMTKNDATGLAGDLECSSAIVVDNNSGAQKKVHVTAHWDAHP
jgi:hypothetical protein